MILQNLTVDISDSIFDFDSVFLLAVLSLVLPLAMLERISASSNIFLFNIMIINFLKCFNKKINFEMINQ